MAKYSWEHFVALGQSAKAQQQKAQRRPGQVRTKKARAPQWKRQCYGCMRSTSLTAFHPIPVIVHLHPWLRQRLGVDEIKTTVCKPCIAEMRYENVKYTYAR